MRFVEHCYRTSASARRTKRACCLLTSLFFASWAAYYYWQIRVFDFGLILLGGQAVLCAVFLPRGYDRLSLMTMYRELIMRPELSDEGLLRLVVDPDAVTEVAPNRETRRGWADIFRVEETDCYLYLFDTAKSAIIIPHYSFTDRRAYEEVRRQILEYAPKRAA
ncbi:MAG: YcxB-like protein [Verrucomicrobiales bacterium]|nr:YcxB-like protein [Verrucomicrobiales bacterium]